MYVKGTVECVNGTLCRKCIIACARTILMCHKMYNHELDIASMMLLEQVVLIQLARSRSHCCCSCLIRTDAPPPVAVSSTAPKTMQPHAYSAKARTDFTSNSSSLTSILRSTPPYAYLVSNQLFGERCRTCVLVYKGICNIAQCVGC